MTVTLSHDSINFEVAEQCCHDHYEYLIARMGTLCMSLLFLGRHSRASPRMAHDPE